MDGITPRSQSHAGFSAIELIVTLGIFGTVASMAAVQIGSARPSFVGDGALRQVVAQLNIARERALTERRNFRVEFLGTSQVRLTRQEVPAGTTVLPTVDIEGGVVYGLTPNVPDTPDVFGNTREIDFGAAGEYWFTSGGTLTDQNATPISGTVFLTLPGQARAARAVTILGATGRIRGYRWDGRVWERI
jgi:prepilin-type N-terminal cleavage/methylation domain-containing protein